MMLLHLYPHTIREVPVSDLLLPSADDLASLLWLNAVPRVGPAAARALLAHFGSPRAIVRATSYPPIEGVRPHVIEELGRVLRDLTPFAREAERLLTQCQALQLHILTPLSPQYPPQLMTPTSYSPTVLFVAGSVDCLSRQGGAIVGTRSPSDAARRLAHQTAERLAQDSQLLVSGLARGIDGASHRGALDGGGTTVAVLGCGADRIYPAEHADLYHHIRATGAIVTEYIPGTAPSPENLRRRNRLIVSLSRFVLVAECPKDSGAMIAARAALQQHRPLFVLALPAGEHDRERSGTALLAQIGLAAPWRDSEADLQWLTTYQATYRRPASAESRLDDALGKRPNSSREMPSGPTRKRPAAEGAPPRMPSSRRGATPSDVAPELQAELPAQTTDPNLARQLPLVDPAQAVPAPQPHRFEVGHRVRHPSFGAGTIRSVSDGTRGALEIRFETGGLKKITLAFADKLEILPE